MKKFLFVLSFLVCSLGLSMPSFAYSIISPSSCSYLTYNEEGGFYELNTEFKVSDLDAENRSFFRRFTDAYTGKSDDEYIVYESGGVIICLVMSSGTTFYDSSSTYAIVNVPSLGYRYMCSFQLTSGSVHAHQYISGPHSSKFNSPNSVTIISTSFSSIPSKVNYVVDLDGKRLQISDDLGNLEPEEPDPPSSSEPGESIPDTPQPPNNYTPAEPVIPDVESDLVPYDTSVWKTFLDRTRRSIGAITNVSFLLLFLSLAFPFLVKLIKNATK